MANSRFWGATPETEKNINTKGKKVKMSKEKRKIGTVGKIIFGFLGLFLVFLVILFIFVIRPGLSLYADAQVLKDDFSSIGDEFQNRDLVSLNEVLDKTEADLKKVKNDKDEKFAWAKNTKMFKANEYYSDFDRFVSAGLYGVDAIREASKVITPFADAAGLKVSPDQELPKAEGLM